MRLAGAGGYCYCSTASSRQLLNKAQLVDIQG